MRLISANVNGIRATLRRGGLDWLAAQQPDVVTLQEVRATSEQLSAALEQTPFDTWHIVDAPGPAAGRAGVAVLSRLPVVRRSAHLPGLPDEGRWVEADIRTESGDCVTVISTYVHTGEAGTPKQDDKYALLDAATTRLAQLRDGHVVLTGDLNVCHTQRDLKNWKGNRGKAGFLPDEQARLSTWFDDGWVDVGRAYAGDVDGPYTWWSWRGKAFDNDAGWRIDYQIASPALGALVKHAEVGRAATYAERWSDHAAVVVDYVLD
ncbi:exodeoxyribonuclease III [Luteipulveratus halotolerans]|uniref:Exodeoxyribonuclease III n=1 Tax=Luteipulveratus halotolerans TaxID=1631356 RepID=A0A0L6CK15_9MICO|nr:exodeoxyribonuclease III [Luteipulveratus halotolerans]KNX37863.1 exodeoxyribonuclease III [Luteipulveratus halotolerans]